MLPPAGPALQRIDDRTFLILFNPDALGLDPEPDPDLSGRTLAEEQRAIRRRRSSVRIRNREVYHASLATDSRADSGFVTKRLASLAAHHARAAISKG